MLLRNVSTPAAVIVAVAFIFSAEVQAEDWMQKSITVAGGGTLEFEHPEYWGKKPDLDVVEGMRSIRFGPYGPRKKPFFLAHFEAIVALEPVTPESLLQITEGEVASFKTIAIESDVPINDINGPNVAGHYFSITDKASKIREFDYLTLAILSSEFLLIKCYFFSSDGAPDFGADAMQMMRSISYTAPPPEPEGKKK